MFMKFFKNSILLLCIFFTSGAALAAPDMSVGNVSGLPGTTVTVPVTFTNGTGINAASSMLVRINYDATKLTFTPPSTATGLGAANFIATDSTPGGTITVQAITTIGVPPLPAFTNGTINLQFTINAGATGTAAVTLQAATTADTFNNTSGNDIPTTVINFTGGAVTVTQPNTAGTASITGTPVVGQTLTASVADANGTTGVTIAYQWFANGVAIAGATGMTYQLTQNELSKTITVQATYTDQNGYAENPTSAATAAVTPTTTNTNGVATIIGTPQVGQTLTANVSDANGINGAITYQWLADGTAINGATAATYTPTADDVGKVISVRATYTNQAGTQGQETVTSAATAAVTSAPITTSGPANIPVFGPFGLLAVLAGLFWFGNRRRQS